MTFINDVEPIRKNRWSQAHGKTLSYLKTQVTAVMVSTSTLRPETKRKPGTSKQCHETVEER